ncbi:MAG: Fic family protein [Candidatus Margulisiibacteriota bacterium]
MYKITPYMLNLIDETSALRAWIELAPLQVAWLPVLQKEARAKTAHFSTSIEGNVLTLAQVRAVERGEPIGAAQTQEQEVANYLKAMRWIETGADNKLDENAVLQLHKIITRGLLDSSKSGRYKEKQNWVVDENKIKVFSPTSPKETPQAVEELLDWLNNHETRQLHSILVCALFHHRFVSIHPFSDGNGRLARALGTLILYQRDYDLHHIFSLDEYFAGNRQRYYQKLQQARALDGNLTHWIEYVAEGVVKTLKNVKARIEGLQVTASYPVNLSPKQEEVLRILRDNPALRVAEFKDQLNVTRARVNQILTPLIKSGLVMKEGESRATRYKLNIH